MTVITIICTYMEVCVHIYIYIYIVFLFWSLQNNWTRARDRVSINLNIYARS